MVLRSELVNRFFCRWWIPTGFALFLILLFWAPSSHTFKVVIPHLLLLPALLAAIVNPKVWLSALRLPLICLTLSYLVYLLLVTLALNNSEDIVDFGKWVFYILMFLLAIGSYMNISERTLTQLLLVGAIAGAAAGIYAVCRDIHNDTFWQPLYRLKGMPTMSNELRAGFLFGTFALFSFWCMHSEILPRWQRQLSFVTAVICLAATLLTGSRAPLLALAAVGVVITASKKLWLHAILVIVISTVILALFWERLSERGLSLRPEIWRYVWQQCLDHPWFGIGLSRSPIEVPTSLGIKHNTHNIFLAVFYQGGFFGLLMFAAMIATTFYQSWSLRRINSFGMLAVSLQLYALISLQFEGIALITRPDDNWVLLWLPIALYVYAHRMANKNGASPECAAS